MVKLTIHFYSILLSISFALFICLFLFFSLFLSLFIYLFICLFNYLFITAPAVLINQTGVTTERTQKAAAVTLAPGLQSQTGTVFSATEILSKVEVGQMGQKYSSEAVNIAEIAASGGLTEEKRKEITKNLMEKHTLECAQLENELRSNEIKIISEVITAYEEKKGKALSELQVTSCEYINN